MNQNKASIQTIAKSLKYEMGIYGDFHFYATRHAPQYIKDRVKEIEWHTILAENKWEALAMMFGDLMNEDALQYVGEQIAMLEEESEEE